MIGLRWYLARAKDGYLRETATYSQISATLTETVEGARTDRGARARRRAGRRDRRRLRASYDAERYTLHLRTVFFPIMDIAYLLPTVATLLFGGWLYTQGTVVARPR